MQAVKSGQGRVWKPIVKHEYGQMVEGETRKILVAELEVANTFWKRAIGLLGRSRLESASALWIEPCNGIHTFGLRFPIDVLFLDREGRAVRVVSNLRPWRICGPVRGARVVVELPAGTLVEQNIGIGSRYERTGRRT
jgi:uncharacterized protein